VRSVGILSTALLGVLGVAAVALGVRSIPDIKRYLKMRAM
jgi:hypothetical protein